MRKLVIPLVVLGLAGAGCRDFQRQDHPATGFANALECVAEQGDTAQQAVALCGRRSFAPGTSEYRGGWQRALECASGQAGSAADAADACRASG